MSVYQPGRRPAAFGVAPYGLHVPYDQGYDARTRATTPRAEDKGASGYLRRDHDQSEIALWVTDLSSDFSLSGEAGQSQLLREFFPRSFNDVTVTITGNVASTQEYNRLALFVREAHWWAINAARQNLPQTPTITFGLDDHTPAGWSARATHVKGRHRPWMISGYIGTMAAGAQHATVAPSFTIDFVVTKSTASSNLWLEEVDDPAVLKNILDLVNVQKVSDRVQGQGFATSQGAAEVRNVALPKIAHTIWSVGHSLETLF